MSEVVALLATLFALGMMGLGLAVFVKGAREASHVPASWPNWPTTKLR
ncbi:MAG TPA: hypothetical protein VGM25_02980 [Caulobacteraceae bacterium]|jgi:hypothetical protein